MKTIKILLIIIILINFSNITSANDIKNITLNKNTIYVDADNTEGPWNGTKDHPFQYIQDGVNNSINGDNIYVFEGIYNETIILDKAINLIGENKKSTIIDGKYKDTIINITIDKTTIENFTIKNSGGYKLDSAIKIKSNNNIIYNCSIYRAKIGVLIKESSNNQIDNCSFDTNGGGILINQSENNVISGCYFCHNSIGIHLENSNENKIIYCYLQINGISCLLENSTNIQFFHCNVSDNQVNLGGFFIFDSKNIFVNNCKILHNGAGFHIYSSDSIYISYCEINLNTHYAVILRTPSKNIDISNCNIKDNYRYAFYFEKSNSCKITNCNIYNNSIFGIYSILSYINSKFNYWGSPFGPSFNFFRKSSRIGGFLNIIKFFPWSIKLINNIGSDWDENEPYMKKEISIHKKVITLPGIDRDLDGAPDAWEEKWGYNPLVWDDHENLDPDSDGLSNLEECYTDVYNSSPFFKDVFLEIDWMKSLDQNKSNKPNESEIKKIVEIFENHSINLHIDLGNLGGGREIPYCNAHFSFARIRDLYWDYFLLNDLNNQRKGIFHYAIICNYCPDLNFPFIGWDQFDTLAISAEWLKDIKPLISKDRLVAGAIVHHLGHTLGLIADTYQGIDNHESSKLFTIQWWKYRNYKSCMNYYWKFEIYTYSNGSHGIGDFNDWDNLDFDFFKNTNFELL